MNKVYVPARTAEDWWSFTQNPDKPWETSQAARALAVCWQASKGFPPCVRRTFQNASIKTFKHIEPLLIFPQHKVSFPGDGTAARNDIFVLARSASQLVSIVIEGQCDTSFDRTSSWDPEVSAGQCQRLEFICSELNIPTDSLASIPYQLLQRTVSAILMARRFQAGIALMLVHAFRPQRRSFDDYAAFATLFGIRAAKNAIQPALRFDGLILYLGWADGDPAYLNQ